MIHQKPTHSGEKDWTGRCVVISFLSLSLSQILFYEFWVGWSLLWSISRVDKAQDILVLSRQGNPWVLGFGMFWVLDCRRIFLVTSLLHSGCSHFIQSQGYGNGVALLWSNPPIQEPPGNANIYLIKFFCMPMLRFSALTLDEIHDCLRIALKERAWPC